LIEPKESVFVNMIYGDIFRKKLKKNALKKATPTRQRKFDLCYIARPSQQQLSSCFTL